MKKKTWMDLRLFDGGEGGPGGSGGAGAGSGSQAGSAGYTFEQAEEIANSRAEKATRAALADFYRKQGLSEAEITTAINEFKAKQKANQPDVAAIEKERDEAQKELQQYKNEKILTAKGVRTEDLDYVMFKVEKLVDDKTDFTKAAEKFLKDNPKYTGASSYRVTTSSKADESGTGGNMNSSINNAIRNAIKK